MFSLLESALCLWIQVHPLWIQGLKRLVLWTQNLTLLEDQGLWIQPMFFIYPALRLRQYPRRSDSEKVNKDGLVCNYCKKNDTPRINATSSMYDPPTILRLMWHKPHSKVELRQHRLYSKGELPTLRVFPQLKNSNK